MRNVNEFPLIQQERLRIRDRLRFLIYGRAFKRRFAARAARQGIIFTPRQPAHPPLLAAAGIALLALIAWFGGELREVRMRNQAIAADLYLLRQRSAQAPVSIPAPPAAERAVEARVVREKPDPALSSERAELQRAKAGLERAWAGSRDLVEQLKQAREQLDALRQEMAGARTSETRLSDRLRETEERLHGATAELAHLQANRVEDTQIMAAQKLRLRELTDRLNAESETIDRERKLLVADLDIRELMGARSLHIVDVFDVDGKGKTQRPFGRIFYTEGKSLVFYAFDLKNGSTFQAWGQREARDESAQSLGIFYVDDQKQNRWVLKFDNPKVLAEINSVFVTVEPPGGSAKPNRQKMLYAYLNATPNHP